MEFFQRFPWDLMFRHRAKIKSYTEREIERMISSSDDSERSTSAATVELYLSLAEMSARQDQRSRQVRFLFLAAREAQRTGFSELADLCRTRLLEQNPDHPISRFATMAEAMTDREVDTYGNELAEIYPPPKAEYLLDQYQASGYGIATSSEPKIGQDVTQPMSDTPVTATVETGSTEGEKKKKRKNRSKRKRTLAHKNGFEESSLPSSALDQPLPFEWPHAPSPVSWHPHPLVILAFGFIGGFLVGALASPMIRFWVEQMGRSFTR